MAGPYSEDAATQMAYDDSSKPPSYLSARSADVILSDIRPTTLANDALDSVNALLDELLHNILSAARALTTSQLRAGLHKVLPTTLGKEAVLEAEMELRAYWERTGGAPGSGSSQVVVDNSSFHLQSSFELLRLKCEGYSTLSDMDENSDAEARLLERMGAEGVPIPKQSQLAPASLYLTAIIESICEHVLSNVGRVAARDSSRATANSQDLFIALCEDSTIYSLFKTMKVYERIESLSKLPKVRRSKSLTRDKLAGATSPLAESFRLDGSFNGSQPRMSSESSTTSPTMVANLNNHSSRSSLDKSRAIKIFNNRTSQDLPNGSEQSGHRKTDSFASANAKQSIYSIGDKSPISTTFSEDTRSQEFDDMMRSGSTMKVSLTPDRLRTMEIFTKDKARPNGRQKVKGEGTSNSVPTSPEQPKRTKKPSLRHVDSIIEDEEERGLQKPPPTSRPRQLSAATASGYSATSFTRLRAASTSDPSKLSLATPTPPMPFESKSFSLQSNSAPASVTRRKAPPKELDINASRPPRTRTVARNRESLDLDDVMGGSDEENMEAGLKPPAAKPHEKQRGLSASARELIDFLAEGPPEPHAHGKPSFESSPSLTPKKSGRLQKMISKITLTGSNESSKNSPRKMTVGSQDAANKSLSNLSPLANRPIPPRYPSTGPPSSSSSDRTSGDQEASGTRQRTQSFVRKPAPAWNGRVPDPEPPLPTVSGIGTVIVGPGSPDTISKEAPESDFGKHSQPVVKATYSSPSTSTDPPRTGSPPPGSVRPTAPVAYVPERVSSKTVGVSARPKPPPALPQNQPLPPALIEQARDMRKLLAHAMSADECRLLVDMFLTRTKLVSGAELQTLATACPDPSVQESTANIEKTLVGLFLGDSEPEPSVPPSVQHEQTEQREVNANHSPSPALDGNTEAVESS